ncbi:MAG: hypothetical protein A3G32_03210 [Deltaproteobacteria bacterium RIFCSPLOWO2_12_FULL_40_28]|nr:MAG: hypothetical protein A3C45_01895 [Deltaproteobacteria bacterium RIFCSPHIGHO2_02_FULL_40_28]OGQ19479.1 MAG: hypothetical protein A3E27_01965 [Deltaproteobacteria bacterium RIFCSPHIGHO2_12_FULL_40_32]OGQ39953.1 MAG: hypothetical protein A3I69_07930 [Deltaproteobacteria bacterium RIFCSPLOWO2_02_FULL_40_36]OGQ54373.1 MAG: hypothetical protein A3G32_03210 [Deltaproteobacteria bacterium RIFCSPLOWO2_12_FULL_40_28]
MRLKKIKIFLFCFCFISEIWAGITLSQKLQEHYQTLQFWSADFEQQTYVEILDKKIKKQGRIFMKKSGEMRIEYQGHGSKTYISNGKKVWIYSPDLNQTEVFDQSKLLSKEAITFLNGLGDLEKDFATRSFNPVKDPSFRFDIPKELQYLELIPRKKSSVISKILLGIEPVSSLVTEATLSNVSGNVTRYVFKNIDIKTNPSQDLFTLEE